MINNIIKHGMKRIEKNNYFGRKNIMKSIKGHAYDSAKQAWTGVKEGKKYIYDKTWGLTD